MPSLSSGTSSSVRERSAPAKKSRVTSRLKDAPRDESDSVIVTRNRRPSAARFGSASGVDNATVTGRSSMLKTSLEQMLGGGLGAADTRLVASAKTAIGAIISSSITRQIPRTFRLGSAERRSVPRFEKERPLRNDNVARRRCASI